MPQIVFTVQAGQDIARFKAFLDAAAPTKTAEAIRTILAKIKQLEHNPQLGVPIACDAIPDLKKLVIPYKKNGYVALYKYDPLQEIIVIETIRHMLELEPKFLRAQKNRE